MTDTALLTLGRLPKALDVARALKAAGWRVIVAEPFPWHLARVSRAVDRSVTVRAPNADPEGYLDDLEAAIDRHGVSLVAPVSEEIVHAARLRDRIARRGSAVRLYAPPPEEIERVHDKLSFARLAAGLGLPVPPTAAAGEAEAAAIAAAGRHVVKPSLSCSGIGVRIRDAGEEGPLHPGDLVQAHVAGEHLSTFAVARSGRVLVNVTYRGIVFSGTVAVAFERVDDAADVDDWVARFVAGTGWSGFISFDFIRDGRDGVVRAIECNPRVTSGVHFVAPEGLAAAMLSPEETPAVPLAGPTRFQQFWPCLTETQASAFRGVGPGSAFRRNLAGLLGSRDVTWSARDPLPLLTMPFTSWTILRRTLFSGESFGEASTRDIAVFSDGGRAPGSARAGGS